MTINMILAPIRGDGKGQGILALAVAFAERFRAHVDVVHVHARPEDLLPFGVPVPGVLRQSILEAVANTARQEEGHLRGLFENFCTDRGLRELAYDADPAGEQGVTLSWREEVGKQAEIIAELGRLADLVVVARPEREGNLGRNTLEAALFDAGKLTALALPVEVGDVGRKIAVAWNGNAESSHAVTMAIPILAQAAEVTVLAARRATSSRLGAGDLCRYLRRHGCAPRTVEIEAEGREVGARLLQAAQDCAADMLLMGAYGSEIRRDLVLGGVTQYVIDHAELPIVMAR